jgi:FMN-dependent NADH-azoreductase
MPILLHIDSSPRSASVSSQLAATFVNRWKKQNPSGTVIHHNTTNEKVPFVDEPALDVLYGGLAPATEDQKHILALSEQFIEEFLAADVIVLGIPMWNFGIPASLKAWIDLVSRPGRTFGYVEGGGVASLVPAGKKVVILLSSGGGYQPGSPYATYNQVEPYLRTIFAFFGLVDVPVVRIENQNRSGDAAAEGLAVAEAQLAALPA